MMNSIINHIFCKKNISNMFCKMAFVYKCVFRDEFNLPESNRRINRYGHCKLFGISFLSLWSIFLCTKSGILCVKMYSNRLDQYKKNINQRLSSLKCGDVPADHEKIFGLIHECSERKSVQHWISRSYENRQKLPLKLYKSSFFFRENWLIKGDYTFKMKMCRG